MNFSPQELERYSRHLILPEFNIEGQKKLKRAKVLIIGAGGLGSPALLYLAAAGIGHIGIVDFDKIDRSNLQRQVLFSERDVNESKAKVAADKLRNLNPYIEYTVYAEALTGNNALDIIRNWDVVLDGTDNFQTRYLVNDSCVILNKPYIYGSIHKFEGQVSVFNAKMEDGTPSPHYRDLFPTPPNPDTIPSCAEGGVLGVLPGIIGTLQATETIKLISGIGEPLISKLYVFDALTFQSRIISYPKTYHESITSLIDYEEFCGLKKNTQNIQDQSITVQELRKWKVEKRDFQLIDVRELYEYEISNLEGELIPLNTIEANFESIRKDIPVVVHCRTGKRSQRAINLLKKKGYSNLHNLEGGILEWMGQIDKNLRLY